MEIEIDEMLAARAKASFDILTIAGDHANASDSTAEGILVLLFALVFVAKQYSITPKELASSIKSVRTMIERAQKSCGTEAGIFEMMIETGLN